MNTILTNLKNFSFIRDINSILPNTEGYEYTTKGVIRGITKPNCECCGRQCVRNGWDRLTRKGLFTLKIGRFRCPYCNTEIQKDLSFREEFISSREKTLSEFFLRLSDRDIALRAISKVMSFLTPLSKDSVLHRIFASIPKLIIPAYRENTGLCIMMSNILKRESSNGLSEICRFD